MTLFGLSLFNSLYTIFIVDFTFLRAGEGFIGFGYYAEILGCFFIAWIPIGMPLTHMWIVSLNLALTFWAASAILKWLSRSRFHAKAGFSGNIRSIHQCRQDISTNLPQIQTPFETRLH